MPRNPALDALRGVLLLLMTMTHLPTVWSDSLGQPLGFISAAEGFVLLSAYLAGRVFTAHEQREGRAAASRWAIARALRLYLLHLALLALAFTLIAAIASTYDRPAARNLLSFYFEAPARAVLRGAMLAYQPPLLDILPMYVLFLLGTPAVMGAASRFGWRQVIGVSVIVWSAAQFGLRQQVYSALETAIGWDVPMSASGPFDLYAWQLLWVLGLWLGAAGFGRAREIVVSGHGILAAAAVVSCLLLFWRHYSGPMGFSDTARHFFWIDKWTLSPVRMLNLAALICVFLGLGPDLFKQVRFPPVETLGRASQWVFVAHIATALLLLCLVGQDDQPLSGLDGALVIAIGYLSLFVTAHAVGRMREAAAAR